MLCTTLLIRATLVGSLSGLLSPSPDFLVSAQRNVVPERKSRGTEKVEARPGSTREKLPVCFQEVEKSEVQVPLRRLGLVRAFRGHKKLVQAMAFSPDGRYLVTGGLDHVLILWDVATGKKVHDLTGHTGNVQCIAFTPDGTKVVSGSAYGDNTIRLWDVKTGKELRQFTGHSAPGVLYALQMLPSGRHFVSCGYDGTIRFWDLESGKQVRVIHHWTHPTQMTYVVTFSADGRYAILGGQHRETKLIDLLVNDEVLTLETQTVEASFSPGNGYFLTSNVKGETVFWVRKTGKKFLQLEGTCAVSPDGRLAVTQSGVGVSLPSGEILFKVPGMAGSAFSRDGRYLVGRGDPTKDGNIVRMWQIAPNP